MSRRHLPFVGGGVQATKPLQASWHKGMHMDQRSPTPVTAPLLRLFTWLQWTCPLCGYAKKEKEKSHFGCFSNLEFLPHGEWRSRNELWCSWWCSFSFSLSASKDNDHFREKLTGSYLYSRHLQWYFLTEPERWLWVCENPTPAPLEIMANTQVKGYLLYI